jgi:hypothetical protein
LGGHLPTGQLMTLSVWRQTEHHHFSLIYNRWILIEWSTQLSTVLLGHAGVNTSFCKRLDGFWRRKSAGTH